MPAKSKSKAPPKRARKAKAAVAVVNKGGRPGHEPTELTRKTVETMSGYGVPELGIAQTLGISDVTLRKHYRVELDNGITKANAAVGQSLFQKATSKGVSQPAVTAAIWWSKTRMGWKETVVNEHTGKDGKDLPEQPASVVLFQLPENGRS